MLCLYRKSGQGVEVKNHATGETYDFDYLHNDNPTAHYKVNGKEKEFGEMSPFYLDPNREIMVVVIAIEAGVRFGIDAPRHWNIRRKEVKDKMKGAE